MNDIWISYKNSEWPKTKKSKLKILGVEFGSSTGIHVSTIHSCSKVPGSLFLVFGKNLTHMYSTGILCVVTYSLQNLFYRNLYFYTRIFILKESVIFSTEILYVAALFVMHLHDIRLTCRETSSTWPVKFAYLHDPALYIFANNIRTDFSHKHPPFPAKFLHESASCVEKNIADFCHF